MGILPYVSRFFFIDVGTAVKVLFFGNLFFCLLLSAYRASGVRSTNLRGLRRLVFAKSVQCAGYSLIMLSWMPNPFWFDFGMLFVYVGMFVESLIMIDLSRCAKPWIYAAQTAVFVIIFIGVSVGIVRDVPFPVRVSLTSAAFLLMPFLPGIVFIAGSGKSLSRKFIGALYLSMFLISLLRSFEFLSYGGTPARIDMMFQNITFLLLILIMQVGSTGILLLSKEDADAHIRSLAFFDDLTGLLNRRHFRDEASLYFAHHARYAETLAMIFIDLDHFKKINDTYGHAFGDEVLKGFASLLRRNLRASDLCCRYGGEEFVLFLSNTNVSRAASVCDRILAAAPLERFDRFPEFSYTVSIGLYVTVPSPGNGETLESCVEKGDKAMYRAKTLGRNRVETYMPDAL